MSKQKIIGPQERDFFDLSQSKRVTVIPSFSLVRFYLIHPLVDVYIKQVRSLLEFAAVVWHPSLRNDDRLRIERVQKSALCIILGENYRSYKSALKEVQLESLFSRRNRLCKKFAKKSMKSSKFSKWFKPNDRRSSTRLIKPKFCEVVFRTERFRRSPISYLTEILNLK